MAQYRHLPIYKATYDLLLRVTEVTRHYPRDFKFFAAQIRNEIMEIILLIYRANSYRAKRARRFLNVLMLSGFRYNNHTAKTRDSNMKINPLPPIDYLRECFSYNPDTGLLTWQDRPDSHFQAASKAKRHRTLYAGRQVGTLNPNGYLVVRLTHDAKHKLYPVHRIAFAMHHGDTELLVDHINGNRTDNRIANLRAVTHGGNLANMHAVKRQGLQGAFWDQSRGKWLAQIKRNYRSVHIGRFDTEQEAHAAYLIAKETPA